MTLKHKAVSAQAQIHVLQETTSSACLLSFSTAADIGLLSINCNLNTQSEVVSQFPLLFHNLDRLKTMKMRLHINEDIRSVAQRHDRVTFHLQEAVEKELEMLLKHDIIERSTGPTPRVSPIVLVPKKDSKGCRAHLC